MAGITNSFLSLLFVFVLGRENNYDKIFLSKITLHGYLFLSENATLLRCGVLCLSTSGCKSFNHESRTCRILSGDGDVIGYANISSMYIEPKTQDACTLAGYQPLLDGLYCVKLFPDVVSWHTANTTCADDGGSLIILKTAEFDLKFNALSIFNGTRYWIGGNDLAEEGKFVWLDGSEVIMYDVRVPEGPSFGIILPRFSQLKDAGRRIDKNELMKCPPARHLMKMQTYLTVSDWENVALAISASYSIRPASMTRGETGLENPKLCPQVPGTNPRVTLQSTVV